MTGEILQIVGTSALSFVLCAWASYSAFKEPEAPSFWREVRNRTYRTTRPPQRKSGSR